METAMRLTRAGEYAVRCILYLSGQKEGAIVSRKEITREMDIPEQFLGKIAQQLARSGFIEIVQGARGGYRLLMPPGEITLLDVIESVIGEIFLNDCIMRPDSCSRSASCSVNAVWEKARTRLRDILREATFDRLLVESSCMNPQSQTPAPQNKGCT
jgi:Rrf2 family protein